MRVSNWDQTAVESWQWRYGAQRSRIDNGGLAKPTAIKNWQRRSGEAYCDREEVDERRRRRRKRNSAIDIKSNISHSAGEQKYFISNNSYHDISKYKFKYFISFYIIEKNIL